MLEALKEGREGIKYIKKKEMMADRLTKALDFGCFQIKIVKFRTVLTG